MIHPRDTVGPATPSIATCGSCATNLAERVIYMITGTLKELNA